MEAAVGILHNNLWMMSVEIYIVKGKGDNIKLY